jgi:hypothetical protein
MWVDVVCLRRDGMKLPQEMVRAAAPVRGFLTIDTVALRPPPGEEHHVRCDIARLWLDRSSAGTPFGALEYVRVSRAGGAGLLVVGIEGGRGAEAHPQAWWCRVILKAGEPVHSTPTESEWSHTSWTGTMPVPLTDPLPGTSERASSSGASSRTLS